MLTTEQRTRLDNIANRVGLDAAKELVRTMRRIDDRQSRRPILAAVYRDGQRFRAARHARYRELIGAFVLIAACIAALIFV